MTLSFLVNGFNIQNWFVDNRISRELIFKDGGGLVQTYFILFSSSALFWLIGLVALKLKRKYIVLVVLVGVIADTITHSRSSLMAVLVGLLCGTVLFGKLSMKKLLGSVFLILTLGVVVFIGQGGISIEIFFLRFVNYLVIPPSLYVEILNENNSALLFSLYEVFLWPMEFLVGHELIATNHEYEFYNLGKTPIVGNVFIPSYSFFTKLSDFIVFLFCGEFLILMSRLIHKNLKSLFVILLIGPMNIMISPFLAEKAILTLFILIFILDKLPNVRNFIYN